MDVAEGLRDEFRRAIEARSAPALRALLEREPAARALLDEPLFSFGAQALNSVAGDPRALDLVDALLELGADPNARSDWWAGGFHPLYSATGPAAERLLAAGAVADACGAAHLDRADLLRAILHEDPSRVHERGGDGQTPLHFARSQEVADLLIEHGADLDARDRDHRASPAEWMVDGRGALARHLVERGATADVFLASALGMIDRLRAMLARDPALLELRTGQGDYGEKPPSSFHIYTWTLGQNLSPLQVAAKFNQTEARDVLLAFASEKQHFLDACADGREDEARALLRARPDLMEQLTPDDRATLPNAGWAARADAVTLMLDLGFDPAVLGSFGGTVLHGAAWEGSAACVEAILRDSRAAELLELRDPTYDGTPLHWCCHGASNCGNPRADHPRVARLLIDAGAQSMSDPDHVRADVAAVLRSRSD
jgi:ankyrin repeat protein